MIEIWKDIQGYEGLYLISDSGRVKSLGRHHLSKCGSTAYKTGRFLKQSDIKGYKKVTLFSDGGVRRMFFVHRLVANAFIEKSLNKEFVNHKDCNKSNNHFSNLEWCTTKENVHHAIANDRFSSVGENNPKAKLDKFDILHIKLLSKDRTVLKKEIAFGFGVSGATIWGVLSGKYWNK